MSPALGASFIIKKDFVGQSLNARLLCIFTRSPNPTDPPRRRGTARPVARPQPRSVRPGPKATRLKLRRARRKRLAHSLSSGIPSGRLRIQGRRRPAASLTAAAVVLAALGGTGSWWRAHQSQVSAARRPVVAVLPLDNVSSDPHDDYLGVGLADTLITRLAAISAVTVVSRSATLEQRGRPTAAIARELGATYLVS